MLSHARHKLVALFFVLLSLSACKKKDDSPDGQLQQTSNFSSDVVVRWLNQQLNMFRLPLATGATAPSADRAFAYSGIALYESCGSRHAGLSLFSRPAKRVSTKCQPLILEKPIIGRLLPMRPLQPLTEVFFPTPRKRNKDSMNLIESELQAKYAQEMDSATLQRSIQFGRAVAQEVWSWAQGDGTAVIAQQQPYVIPGGTGLWTKEYTTAAAANPYII